MLQMNCITYFSCGGKKQDVNYILLIIHVLLDTTDGPMDHFKAANAGGRADVVDTS